MAMDELFLDVSLNMPISEKNNFAENQAGKPLDDPDQTQVLELPAFSGAPLSEEGQASSDKDDRLKSGPEDAGSAVEPLEMPHPRQGLIGQGPASGEISGQDLERPSLPFPPEPATDPPPELPHDGVSAMPVAKVVQEGCSAQETIQNVASFLCSVLEDPRLPEEMPPVIEQCEQLQNLTNDLVSLRRIISAMAKGDFSVAVDGRGYVAGSVKAMLANLRHLIWQTRQVAEGDFSQRVQFLGDFSSSFNQMTRQLETTLKKLKENEASLLKKNQELSAEIQYRIHIEDALRESERNYQRMSTQDPLTGIYNRRYFWLAGEQEIRRGSRSGSPLSLIMLDIDFFKKVNDNYGHVIGDEVLIKFASYLVAQLRSSDVVVRYGGEEFLVLLPDTSLLLACDLAERLRLGLEKNPTVMDNGVPIAITASAGVSLVEVKSGETPQKALDRAVQQADLALYEAKNSGRNQVFCSKPTF